MTMLTRSTAGKKPQTVFTCLGGRSKEAFELNSVVLAIYTDLVVIDGRGTTYIRTTPARLAIQLNTYMLGAFTILWKLCFCLNRNYYEYDASV